MVTATLEIDPIPAAQKAASARSAEIERIPCPEAWDHSIQVLTHSTTATHAKRRLVLTGDVPSFIAQRFARRAVIQIRRRTSC